jgi:signal recognition particle subunit SRP54
MFDALGQRFNKIFSGLRGKFVDSDLENLVAEVKSALLDSDVALEVVDKFASRLMVRVIELEDEINKSINPAKRIFEIVNHELTEILGGKARRVQYAKSPPTIILLTGLQGAGKTSLAGKLGYFLAQQGDTPLLVAADLQRPNAVNQLQIVGDSVKLPVYAPEPGNGIGDPVWVSKSAINYAKEKLYNFVIIDTAGRTGINEELMTEITSIRKAVNPNEVFFVADSMIGQDAATTARAFAEGVGFDAVVLTKLDGDARGGAALSIVELTGKPIIFTSSGEKVTDFELFYPDRMAARILGLGDIATLAEQAKRVMPVEVTKNLEEKFTKGGEFTLTDFLSQIEALRNMGSINKFIGLLPGAGGLKKQIENFDETELVRTRAIIQSMTPDERDNPKVLNGSRRARIAKGSGRHISEINSLVERFSQAQKVMKQMRGGVMPDALAAVLGMNSLGKGGSNSPKVKKKSRSGNPAKRAAEERG